MSYNKTTWNTGDIITAEKLNNIQTEIETLDKQVFTIYLNQLNYPTESDIIPQGIQNLINENQNYEVTPFKLISKSFEDIINAYNNNDIIQSKSEMGDNSNIIIFTQKTLRQISDNQYTLSLISVSDEKIIYLSFSNDWGDWGVFSLFPLLPEGNYIRMTCQHDDQNNISSVFFNENIFESYYDFRNENYNDMIIQLTNDDNHIELHYTGYKRGGGPSGAPEYIVYSGTYFSSTSSAVQQYTLVIRGGLEIIIDLYINGSYAIVDNK